MTTALLDGQELAAPSVEETTLGQQEEAQES